MAAKWIQTALLAIALTLSGSVIGLAQSSQPKSDTSAPGKWDGMCGNSSSANAINSVGQQLGRRESGVRARVARIEISPDQCCDDRPGVPDRDHTADGHRHY
jgi:hypothetical protein